MFSTLLFTLFIQQVPITRYDPGLDWKTLETENFYIHYPQKLDETARGLAGRVEPVYDQITGRLNWEPYAKTHVVLSHKPDPNGVATPVPYNTVHLFATPPREDTSLDSYDDWITMLFAHEFTHTVHIDMAKGINGFLRNILGRVIVPNAIEPQWIIEGLAMYHETVDTTAGRGRSSFLDMYFRTAALDESLQPIERATYWNDIYPYGNTAYWYGVRFHQYLAEKYGEEKIYALADTNSRWIVPGWFNFKTDEIYGKSLDRLWEEWQASEVEKWETLTQKRKPQFSSTIVTNGDCLLGKPAWHATKDILYAAVLHEERAYLVSYDFSESKTDPIRKIIRAGLAPRALRFYQGRLYYAKRSFHSRYEQTYDLYEFDVEEETEKRLTRGFRLQDPWIQDEKIYAVRSDLYQTSLVELKLPDTTEDDFKTLTDQNKIRYLYSAPDTSVITKPTVSPDNQSLVFSMKRSLGYRDLYRLDLRTKEVLPLTQDTFVDNDPTFIDATTIQFNSDRPLPGQKTLVWNIYELDLATNTITSLSDVWTGTNWPARKGKEIAFGYFTSEGFELRTAAVRSTGQQKRLEKENLPQRIPPILGDKVPEPRNDLESKDYGAGSTLLPHYLLPFFLVTEEDSAFGAQIGSNDPLSFHLWSAFGYFLTSASLDSPNRPGGVFQYIYRGLSTVDVLFGGSAGITNYGNILVVNGTLSAEDYYERTYQGFSGARYRFMGDEGPIGLTNTTSAYYERRQSLLGFPAGTSVGEGIVTFSNGTVIPGVQLRPEEGQSFGLRSTFDYSLGYQQDIRGTAPHRGGNISFTVDYAPDIVSDFHTLVTTLSAKAYYEVIKDFTVGLYTVAGNQWLDVLYQKTFLMGGSLGVGPFNLTNRRSYSLRGLPSSDLSGEGIINGSLEFRFPIFKAVPGFGTAPVWFKNIHAAVFSDFGQVFQYQDYKTFSEVIRGTVPDDLDFNRWTVSGGAELRSDISVSYAPPVTFRAGYGYVFYRVGQEVIDERIDEFYFQIGQSF